MPTQSPGNWQWEFTWTWPNWLTWLPCVLLVGLVIIVLIRSGVPRRRWMPLFFPRLIALGALAVALCRLGWLGYTESKGTLSILVDDSTSMNLNDESADGMSSSRGSSSPRSSSSRWQAVRSMLRSPPTDLRRRLTREFDVDVQGLAPAAERPQRQMDPADLSGQAHEETSPLGDRIISLVEQHRGGMHGILVLSDGRVNRGRDLDDAAAVAAQWNVPLHAVGFGGDIPIRGVRLERIVMDDHAFLADQLVVHVEFLAMGLDGSSVVAEARRASDQALLDRREVLLPARAQVRNATTSAAEPRRTVASAGSVPPWRTKHQLQLSFPAAEVGELVIDFAVFPVTNAPIDSFVPLSEEHPTQRRTVTVTNPLIRTMLIASEPTYEFRALREVLGRSPVNRTRPSSDERRGPAPGGVHLRSVLYSAGANISAVDRTTDSTLPPEWSQNVDIAVLLDVDPNQFPDREQQQLVDHVRQRGGGAIIIAGPNYMPAAYAGRPLTALLPFAESQDNQQPTGSAGTSNPFRFMPTRMGWSLGAMRIDRSATIQDSAWPDLPKLNWALPLAQVLPGTRVLATTHDDTQSIVDEGLPLAMLRLVGNGSVLFHGTDETWRWRFRSADTIFARYWTQMIRHLAWGRCQVQSGVVLRAVPENVRGDEPVHLEVAIADPARQPGFDQSVVVAIAGPEGQVQEVPLRPMGLRPGIWGGEIQGLPIGEYEARIAHIDNDAKSSFRVQPVDYELIDPRPDHRALREAAQRTGGMFVTSDRVDELVQSLLDHAAPDRRVMGFVPLILPWQVALIVCVAIITDWLLRLSWNRHDWWAGDR